jgi:tRNA nucleotidyltransferase (CCA-adding enzyme)
VPDVRPNLIAFTGELADTVEVLELLRQAGGTPFLVGGCVRDALLGLPTKDLDIEVFGIGTRDIENALRKKFGIINVGAAFGVTKLKDRSIDVSVPRRENRTGARHHDFEVQADPTMTPKDAAERRDFTINAISWNPATGEIIDPYDGLVDIKAKVLRHVSVKFSEDPLRVLRAMQFAARLQFTVAPETVKLCASLNPYDLPPERLFEEWSKLNLRGVKPSMGLNFLRDCGWTKFFPELHAMIDVKQDPQWHPEGDVWVHTLECMDVFASERLNDRDEDLIVGLAVLLHDLGKAETTKVEADGRIHAYGHEAASEPLAKKFLDQITRETKLLEEILPLVRWHGQPYELWKTQSGDASVRRLAKKVTRIDRLIRIDSADRQGRGPASRGVPSPQGQWLSERAHALHVEASAPKPILMGRHLIALGYKPSDLFSKILHDANEAQMDGVFTDESSGIIWLKEYLSKNNL